MIQEQKRKKNKEPEILQVFQLKRPETKADVNLVFKIALPYESEPIITKYQYAAKNYPQTVLKYFTKFLVKRRADQPVKLQEGGSEIKCMLDCDQFLDSDEDNHKPVYFCFKKKDQFLEQTPKKEQKKFKIINKEQKIQKREARLRVKRLRNRTTD